MFGLFTVSRITSADVARLILFADGFIARHARLIPPDVQEAWGAFRGALDTWGKSLAVKERGTRS